MKQRSILVTLLLCVLLLTGCGTAAPAPDATPTPTHPLAILDEFTSHGILAQLGEHLPYKQRVIGSSPIGPISTEKC